MSNIAATRCNAALIWVGEYSCFLFKCILNLKICVHLEDLGVDCRITNCILKKKKGYEVTDWIQLPQGIVTCMSDSRWGFGLDIGFNHHLQVVTTNNYITIPNFYTLQITRAHAKSFPACSIFTSSCLVTVPTMVIPVLPCSSLLWMAAPFQLRILRVEFYVTTDGQSASLSWNKAPIWDLRPDFYYCQLRVCWCGALSEGRAGLSFTIATGPRQRSHSRVRVPWDSWPVVLLITPRHV
jgi:hypothetical protein